MLWRTIVSVAVLEVLLCVMPIKLAGIVVLLRQLLGG
jgi:hypothetical protein